MHDEQVEAANDWMAALDRRVLDLDQSAAIAKHHIDTAGLQRQILDERVLEVQKNAYFTQEQIDQANDAHNNLEERTSLLEARWTETQNQSAEAGQATQLSIEQAHATASETQSSLEETRASIEALAVRMDEANSSANDELRDFMVYRIDHAEDRIDRRLADIEAGGVSTDRLENLERDVAEADRRATDAYEFSENLRLLQTDLVQALQNEIETYARDLQDARRRLEELELRFS